MQPEDLVHFRRASGVTVSPDGATIVYAEEHPSLRIDSYTSQLWRVSSDGGAPVRLTRGTRDFAPEFSPDGQMIAFLRAEGGAPQLFVIPVLGGEAFPLTAQPLGVEHFTWSPDGSRIAFLSRQAEPGRYGSVTGVGPGAEPARTFTDPRYRADGIGYTIDRPSHLFVVDAPHAVPAPSLESLGLDGYDFEAEPNEGELPTATRLTDDRRSYVSPVFSEDGTEIFTLVASSAPTLATRVEAFAVSGTGAPRVVIDESAHLQIRAILPHLGSLWLLANHLGDQNNDFAGRNTSLYRQEPTTGGCTALTTAVDIDFGEPGTPLRALADGVLTVARTRGTTQLARYSLEAGLTPLTEGEIEVKSVAVASETIVVTASRPDACDDVAVFERDTLNFVTNLSEPLRERGVRPIVELETTSTDGTKVHGWAVIPEGEGPHPTILMIHGGPHAQYTVSLFDEAQMLASAGYAVVLCNPRGSAGYGEEFARAIVGRFGTDDADDVLRFLEGALTQLPQLDGERLGVMGGSYGGYMTAWLIAHDHRFAGAIVERGFLSPEAFEGIGDIGWFFGQQYVTENLEQQLAQSPLARADAVRTPTLVIHSEDDLRCPIEGAERFVYKLRRNQVPTTFMVFPGENHGLTRNGRPRHRVQRLQAVQAWWEEHLPLTS